jgi:hypothetical protein
MYAIKLINRSIEKYLDVRPRYIKNKAIAYGSFPVLLLITSYDIFRQLRDEIGKDSYIKDRPYKKQRQPEGIIMRNAS